MASTSTRPGTSRLGAIWAQTIDGVIGRDGVMPWHVPEDLQHFKEVTSGKPVIMGRRTWESLPDTHKPLPGRANIIVSRSVGTVEVRDGGIWVSSLDAALGVAHKAQEATNAGSLADAWVIAIRRSPHPRRPATLQACPRRRANQTHRKRPGRDTWRHQSTQPTPIRLDNQYEPTITRHERTRIPARQQWW